MKLPTFNVIVASTREGGIGLGVRTPWNIPTILQLFPNYIYNSVCIMGRKTLETIPKLPPHISSNLDIICVTRNKDYNMENDCWVEYSLEDALLGARTRHPGKTIFIAGGEEIYRQIFLEYFNYIEKIYISIYKNIEGLEVDRWIQIPQVINTDWITDFRDEDSNFIHFIKRFNPYQEKQYLSLLDWVFRYGDERKGRNGLVKSTFCPNNLRFDLTKGFPLLTTKKMFWKGIVEELLFFLRGDTQSKILESKGVNIWKGNTSRDFLDSNGFPNRPVGVMGPMYGYQLRFFGSPYDERTSQPSNLFPGVDQFSKVIEQIMTNPQSRRIMMTTFNPAQVDQGVLPPCHSIVLQFYVSEVKDNRYLDLFCYNRSSDLFLGLPFNIASTALLLSIIAHICKLTPRFMNITLGDAHIYSSHMDAVYSQISREPLPFPELQFDFEESLPLHKLTHKHFKLKHYKHHPSIKVTMVA